MNPEGRADGRIVRGARSLAKIVFDDERQFRSMYDPRIMAELGLFRLGRSIAGRPKTIIKRLAAKETGMTR